MKKIICILIILLAFAPNVLADCAWGLWEKTARMGIEPNPPAEWAILDAVPAFNECNKKKEEWVDYQLNLYKALKKVHKVKDFTHVVYPDTGILIQYKTADNIFKAIYCLPDTIDPRNRQ